MSRTLIKLRLRNTLKKLKRIDFDRQNQYNREVAPQEMLDFLAMVYGIKPVVLIGRGFDDQQWISGVRRIARGMNLYEIEGAKWDAESESCEFLRWHGKEDQSNRSANLVSYICKSRATADLLNSICDKGSITIKDESFLLGYPRCCVEEYYFQQRMMDKGLGLMLNRTAKGDESEIIRLIKEDVAMSPETEEERKLITEATRCVSAPYTSVLMCRTCETNTNSPALLLSKRYKELAEMIDLTFASEIEISQQGLIFGEM